jgi:hypothetical protein
MIDEAHRPGTAWRLIYLGHSQTMPYLDLVRDRVHPPRQSVPEDEPAGRQAIRQDGGD